MDYLFLPYDYSRQEHDEIVKALGSEQVVALVIPSVRKPTGAVGVGIRFSGEVTETMVIGEWCTVDDVHDRIATSTSERWFASSNRVELKDVLPFKSSCDVVEVEGGDWVPARYRRGRVSHGVFGAEELVRPDRKHDYCRITQKWRNSRRYRLRTKFLFYRERLAVWATRNVSRLAPPNSSRRQILVGVAIAVSSGLILLLVNQCSGLGL